MYLILDTYGYGRELECDTCRGGINATARVDPDPESIWAVGFNLPCGCPIDPVAAVRFLGSDRSLSQEEMALAYMMMERP